MPKARLVFDGDGVYTEKEARIHKLTQETETKIDNIPGVVDDVHSTSTTDALSANMGKYLQDQIDNMSGTTIFLSTWDCTTGLPETDPSTDPYTYKTGNYYIVSNVADSGGTNYKPHGSTYTHGTPSTAVETEAVEMNDWYIFDGSQWILQPSGGKVIVIDDMLSPTSRNAVENRAVYSALSQKQNNILDLQAIREGATLGSTSIQPLDNITELTNNAGYQTAGDVAIAIQDALGPVALDVNTKTFYLSSMSDLTNAQAAYDWYKEGKTPIIRYGGNTYFLKELSGVYLRFSRQLPIATQGVFSGGFELCESFFDLERENNQSDVIVGIRERLRQNIDNASFLSTSGVNSSYSPSFDYDPATKKYVDDTVSSASEGIEHVGPTAPSNPTEGQLWYDTTEDKLKVYDGTNWVVTGKEYIAGSGINIDVNNEISVDTSIIATKSYADSAASGVVSDTAFSSSWDGDTTHAPSKNVVYDEMEKKQDTLVSGTSIRKLLFDNNSNPVDLLGSGNINIHDVPQNGSTGQVLTWDGTKQVWADTQSTEYTAGNGIIIGDIDDYSAMQGPCPTGYHVPLSSEWQALYDAGKSIGARTSSGGPDFSNYLKMPFAGCRNSANAGVDNQGSYGYYWSSSRYNTNSAYILNFGSSALSPQNAGTRAYGFSVRCFKDSPVVPTSSWTKLYGTSIESGGIFWSSAGGLISLSSDGQTWITIADKNLGATTVRNSGDTLSEANCGKYYQWGNNYGFPFTGDVTTSSIQVDASNYGPGNYYSSSTFIKAGAWDSTDNGNLRGGVTGVVHKDNAISVDENVINRTIVEGASFGSFVKACTLAGTRHDTTMTSSGTDIGVSYTMHGIGFLNIMLVSGGGISSYLSINGVIIKQLYISTSGQQSRDTSGITLSPGDVITIGKSTTSSSAYAIAEIVDYY